MYGGSGHGGSPHQPPYSGGSSTFSLHGLSLAKLIVLLSGYGAPGGQGGGYGGHH